MRKATFFDNMCEDFGEGTLFVIFAKDIESCDKMPSHAMNNVLAKIKEVDTESYISAFFKLAEEHLVVPWQQKKCALGLPEDVCLLRENPKSYNPGDIGLILTIVELCDIFFETGKREKEKADKRETRKAQREQT